MSDDLRVKVRLQAQGEQKPESAEVIPVLGAMMEFEFGAAETRWRLDYRKPDRLRLRIDGEVGLVRTKDLEITVGGRITRDFFENSTAIQGSLEMEFDGNINVEITGSSGPKGKSAGAGLTIEF